MFWSIVNSFLAQPNSNYIKICVFPSPSKWRAQKCQIHESSPLVLAFKKGLQNRIKPHLPRERLIFGKWSKGIKRTFPKVFSWAKLIF